MGREAFSFSTIIDGRSDTTAVFRTTRRRSYFEKANFQGFRKLESSPIRLSNLHLCTRQTADQESGDSLRLLSQRQNFSRWHLQCLARQSREEHASTP